MKVLILGPNGERIAPAIERAGDKALQAPADSFDWIVSFGHDRIIPPWVIAELTPNLLNIHISLLPWNKGADPNFWSWVDHTPKGVSIHQVTKGLDTGPILAQREVPLSNAHTLRSSYDALMRDAAALFAQHWPDIRAHKIKSVPQPKAGSYHRKADKDALFKRLGYGYDSPCSAVERLRELETA